MYYRMLKLRENLIDIYKSYEDSIIFILKFLIGFMLFQKINEIGLYNKIIINSGILEGPYILVASILFGLIFAIMPLSISYLFLIVGVSLSLSSSIEIMTLVLIVSVLILFFYIRLAEKESILILVTIICFYFKVPYLVPIVAGLYFGITSIFPVVIGVFISNIYPFILDFASKNATSTEQLADIMGLPKDIFSILELTVKYISGNQVWLFQALIFSMVIILVFLISRLAFDYSKEVAIILGGMLTIIGFLVSIVIANLNISILSVLTSSVVSVILALIIKFFDSILDYKKSQKVEFQDAEYYYYVKVIPKVKTKKVSKEKLNSTFKEDFGAFKDSVSDVIGEKSNELINKINKTFQADEKQKIETNKKIESRISREKEIDSKKVSPENLKKINEKNETKKINPDPKKIEPTKKTNKKKSTKRKNDRKK